jgi:hypothetical protein
VTFIRACQHITNYTAGHETRSTLLGDDRVVYPGQHIEADNRLSWMLGKLGKKYGKEALYVHLKRDVEATAASFNRRWGRSRSIIDAYAEGILMRPREQSLELCRDYIETVHENVSYFLRDKPNQITINLEDIKTGYKAFWDRIDAEGDLEKALAELDIRNNASTAPSLTERVRSILRQI